MEITPTIIPQITWVNDTPSSTGKTIKVYLDHPSFNKDITYFSYIPTWMTPKKWDIIIAPIVEIGDIETSYEDKKTKQVIALKKARCQVSFFDTPEQPVAIDNGPELTPTKWVDKRNKVKDDNAF